MLDNRNYLIRHFKDVHRDGSKMVLLPNWLLYLCYSRDKSIVHLQPVTLTQNPPPPPIRCKCGAAAAAAVGKMCLSPEAEPPSGDG